MKWLAIILLVAGCAAFDEPAPSPSRPVGPAVTPWQCEEILKAGGKC